MGELGWGLRGQTGGGDRNEERELWIREELARRLAFQPVREIAAIYAELYDQWEQRATTPPPIALRRRPGPAGKRTRTLPLAAATPAPPGPMVRREIDGAGQVTPDVAEVLDRALRGAAERLDPQIRARLEQLLGRELGDVRIHRDGPADDAARALGARAFAVGRDVFFRDGNYDPGTAEGARLIAHEVVHTQQPERTEPGGLQLSSPGDASEREADALADTFVGVLSEADRARTDQRASEAFGPARPAPAALSSSRRAAVSRVDEPGRRPAPIAIPPGGVAVDQVGVVAWDGAPELRLRATPSTTDDNTIGNLPLNTHVQVIKRFAGDWLFVSTRDGRMGYVAAAYVWTAPQHPLPEPNARLHRVEAGVEGTAIAIAERYFRAVADDWGQDLRFYVNVIAAVNGVSIPSGVDGWRSVHFQAGRFIWIPSLIFARGMRGQVSSGSYTYEAADALGVASVIERAAELLSDFRTAIGLSLQYIPAAVARHAEEAIIAVLQSLALMAVGAIALLAISTAIGAAIGALAGGVGAAPGAAVGFEVGMALLEWIGLAMLVAWLGTSIARIGTAFGAFIGTVWNARGDRAQLELAAHQFAEAIGTLIGVLIEALVMWAAAQGATAAVGALRGTAFGRAFGESRLGTWLTERIARYQRGETTLPGPREALLRARARQLAPRLGLTEAETLGLLRALDAPTLTGLKDEVGVEGLRSLVGRSEGVLAAMARALAITGADPAARAALIEGARLNGRGTLSNSVFEQALDAYTAFRARYGNRASGDFASRFWRRLGQDTRQAEAEIRLAEDLLAGRTPLGEASRVDGLPESTVAGERVPEYRVTTPEGARLVESKAIGEPGRPLTETSVGNNARSANQQLRDQAGRTGETEGGLIRLDGRDAGNTAATPAQIGEWVSARIPSPRPSRVTGWVEVFYRDAGGRTMRVVLRLDGTRFVVHTSEVML